MGKINFTKMKVLSSDEKNIVISTNFKRCKIQYKMFNDGYMLISSFENMDFYDVARFIHKLFYPNKSFYGNLTFLKDLATVAFTFNGCTIYASKENAKVWQIIRRYEIAYKKMWSI